MINVLKWKIMTNGYYYNFVISVLFNTIFSPSVKISNVSPNFKLNALEIFLGIVIIFGGLSPPLAARTFARLRTIFFSFNKKYSLHNN
jgi:hypothetical protein